MKKAICITAVVLLVSSFAFAQDETIDFGYRGLASSPDELFDFNASGYSARNIGMGGIYYAISNEGYGSFLNPAGMTNTNKALMSLSVFLGMDDHKGGPIAAPSPYMADPETGYNIIVNQSDIDAKHNRLNVAGAVTPFYYLDREWWFGAGFRTVYDLHTKVEMPMFVEGQKTLLTQDRGIDAMNAGLATKPMENLSLGVNLNIYVRGYEQNYWMPFNYSTPYGDTSVTGNFRDKSTFTGANLDFGALADFDMIKVGAVINTGFTLTQKTTYLRGQVNPYGETSGAIDRIESKNKFPMSYGGGISFTPMDNFVAGVDITYKPLSKTRIDIDPQQTRYTNINDYDPGWEDLMQFRLGAEYIVDAGFARMPLRVGVQNLPAVYKNQTIVFMYDTTVVYAVPYYETRQTTSSGDQINTYLASLGTGLHFDKIWLDAAYQFGTSDYDQDYVLDYFDTENALASPIKYEFRYSRFYLSVGMLF